MPLDRAVLQAMERLTLGRAVSEASVSGSAQILVIGSPARGVFSRRLLIGGLAGVSSALLYSSFVMAGPLGFRLNPVVSYVSELGARTQPHNGFFRASDVISGVLIVVLAVALRPVLPGGVRREAGVTALTVAGIASVFDGWHPMVCTPSIDAACRLREDEVSALTQLHQAHTLSSVVGIVAAIASMVLVGDLMTHSGRAPVLGRIGELTALVVTALAIIDIPLTIMGGWVGLVERCFVAGISVWLAELGVLLLLELKRVTGIEPA